jgi:polyisoprenyl-phosphate glycosyltransferase
MMADRDQCIRQLQGPILVLGGSGFIGANLTRALLRVRSDVVATAMRLPAWRLEGLPPANVRSLDLLVEANLDVLLDEVRPRTVFDCVAYGAYSFETDNRLIYQTNFLLATRLLPRLVQHDVAAYVHAGSSSEYGDNCTAPAEEARLLPDSDYSVSKVASSALISYYGRKHGLPCTNLRLYSVYGPWEDAARLIPSVVMSGVEGRLPEFVDPRISRDFVFVEDACEAFIAAALRLEPADYGDSFNIGTGRKTTIAEVAETARELFGISAEPAYTMPLRPWDHTDWHADPARARERLGWQARTTFRDGLARTVEWYRSLESAERYRRSSRQFGRDPASSVSAIVACYRDGQAIPIMHQRLKSVFEKMNLDYEIIFVNDGSPDDSEEVIRRISRDDPRVIGITHSRNFGSQAAFRSGMELATKNACVLLDGDLQDPPELIEEFVRKWREGYEVVYGRRVKREAPLPMQIAYKLFYRVFELFSYVPVPRDAGDFSLIDRRVAQAMLRFPERDLFLRGVRAYAGFRQTGVDYVRPERMFGRTTNSLSRNLAWAKRGILSFSNAPLNALSVFGVTLLFASVVLGVVQIVLRLAFPHLTPSGITTVLLVILFFGALNLFAVGLVGEYIAKVFEEVKQRPHFIRQHIVRDGEVQIASDPPSRT